ncbi:hypothetical protein RclHR1_06210003 [Rhizophagus clarus]|uniref:F-box domain-containing protein n=1 Tax=Rhizophagus clarus TaxID=94130 RepID=A0A2Z6RQR2_9GLOM|nr:hypothetical protein RclHR1_06210003 [Rhizophagus clarus]GES99169.1 hypothetical protein GLOIN_2v1787971 [Rhizophagus clarus]
MLHLNKDVLFLIFEELKNDKKTLYSCILVNRTWCVIAIPILWKNPLQTTLTEKAGRILFSVIFSHLSEESRNILKNQGINNIITEKCQRPLFNYISFWKELNLTFLERINFSKNIGKSNVSIVRNEILKLFINRNTKFLELCIPRNFCYQLHNFPGAEHCFSELESLSFHCHYKTSQTILEGLARICKSIKKLRFHNLYYCTDNSGIIKLIEVQKNLNDIGFIYRSYNRRDEKFNKSLEESLIKHVNTIKYLRIDWKPITRILSYLVNLLGLEINMPHFTNWNNENLSFPILRFLKVQRVPSKILASLIENTKGNLSEISIHYDGADSKRLIQAIYQNCSNLRYLKLSLAVNTNSLISEFENLLINCQFLKELIIDINDIFDILEFCWDKLFEILDRSSPISLCKFNFTSYKTIKLEYLKLFLENWKDKRPMLLIIGNDNYSLDMEVNQQLKDLIEEYKMKGIIKNCYIGGNICEDFEWI